MRVGMPLCMVTLHMAERNSQASHQRWPRLIAPTIVNVASPWIDSGQRGVLAMCSDDWSLALIPPNEEVP